MFGIFLKEEKSSNTLQSSPLVYVEQEGNVAVLNHNACNVLYVNLTFETL